MIWQKQYKLEDLKFVKKNIHLALGIQIIEIGDDFLIGSMPVDSNTKQPFGYLHGGASVVLAESLGSLASYMIIKNEQYMAFGQNIFSNHIRPIQKGIVIGKCKPIHIGKKSHVWDIKIVDENNKIISTSRLTTAVNLK